MAAVLTELREQVGTSEPAIIVTKNTTNPLQHRTTAELGEDIRNYVSKSEGLLVNQRQVSKETMNQLQHRTTVELAVHMRHCRCHVDDWKSSTMNSCPLRAHT